MKYFYCIVGAGREKPHFESEKEANTFARDTSKRTFDPVFVCFADGDKYTGLRVYNVGKSKKIR